MASSGASAPPRLYDTAIIWFRRDLRVDDNPALLAALSSARSVVRVGTEGLAGVRAVVRGQLCPRGMRTC